jgi:hypothetical protein
MVKKGDLLFRIDPAPFQGCSAAGASHRRSRPRHSSPARRPMPTAR